MHMSSRGTRTSSWPTSRLADESSHPHCVATVVAQIWTDRDQWAGFLRVCEMAGADSFNILLQLPPTVLESTLLPEAGVPSKVLPLPLAVRLAQSVMKEQGGAQVGMIESGPAETCAAGKWMKPTCAQLVLLSAVGSGGDTHVAQRMLPSAQNAASQLSVHFAGGLDREFHTQRMQLSLCFSTSAVAHPGRLSVPHTH